MHGEYRQLYAHSLLAQEVGIPKERIIMAETGDIISFDQLRDLEAWVAQRIGADSVKYNSLDAFVEALSIPRKELCLKCWDGIRPMGK